MRHYNVQANDVDPAKLRPARGRILVKREPPETVTAQGIVLVEKKEEDRRYEPCFAQVLALGAPELSNKGVPIMYTVQPGDRVLISKFCGHDIGLAGGNHVVISESEILGVLEPAEPVSGQG